MENLNKIEWKYIEDDYIKTLLSYQNVEKIHDRIDRIVKKSKKNQKFLKNSMILLKRMIKI